MMPTPSQLLVHHAPLDAGAPDVVDPRLEAVLRRVLNDTSQRSPRGDRRRAGRRHVLWGLGVAALSATAVLLPAALRSDDAGVQALERLAATAGVRPASVITPGRFLHVVSVDNPDGQYTPITGENDGFSPRTMESWTDADGTIWRHDTEAGGREYWHRFPVSPSTESRPSVSPATLAALPTNGEDLMNQLRRDLGPTTDEGVFVYLNEALQAGYAPAPVQRALIDAMSRLPHIEVSDGRAYDGRPCLKVVFTPPDWGHSPYVCFDEATARLIESGDLVEGAPDRSFTNLVTLREIVDAVPPEVLERAVTAGG